MDFEKLLFDLIVPMVDKPDELSIKVKHSTNHKEVALKVYANPKDLSRLIGRQGMVANSLRQLVGVGAKLENKKLMIHFESNEG